MFFTIKKIAKKLSEHIEIFTHFFTYRAALNHAILFFFKFSHFLLHGNITHLTNTHPETKTDELTTFTQVAFIPQPTVQVYLQYTHRSCVNVPMVTDP